MRGGGARRLATRVVPYGAAAALARLARLYTLRAPWAAGKRSIVAGRHVFRLPDMHRVAAEVDTLVGTRMQVRLPDLIQKSVFYLGVWEPAISAFMRDSLAPGDVVVDVGANVGYHACLAARLVGPEGAVHAIEPSPELCRLLEANVARNPGAPVQVHPVAVMDRPGTVTLYPGPEHSLGIGSVLAPAGDAAGVEVAARPLHEVVDQDALYRARLVKVDVEGAEWSVFRGVAGRLDRFGPATEWIIEITPASVRRQGGTASEIVAAFAAAGYRAYAFENPYDVDWYVRRARAVLAQGPAELVRPLAPGIDRLDQVDILFTRRSYDAPS